MADLTSSGWIFYGSFGLALLGTGAVAGILAGLLGVGGGIVIVPMLFLLFPLLGVDPNVLMHVAVGTSLATIIPTSIVSARSHYRRGGVDLDLLKSLMLPIFVGVVMGSLLGSMVKGEILTLIFTFLAILVSINMVVRKEGMTLADHLPTGLVRHGIGLAIGGISVVMGIGGGTLSVPILTAFNYPIRKAVGTASAIGLIIAVPGSIAFILSGLSADHLPAFSLGYANMLGFALIVPATMMTAPLGAKIAHSINPSSLRLAFAFFLCLTSLKMFHSVLF